MLQFWRIAAVTGLPCPLRRQKRSQTVTCRARTASIAGRKAGVNDIVLQGGTAIFVPGVVRARLVCRADGWEGPAPSSSPAVSSSRFRRGLSLRGRSSMPGEAILYKSCA